MKKFHPLLLLFSCLLMLAFPTFAAAGTETFHDALSLQGYTGIMNVPTAGLTAEGRMYLMYSDQEESVLRDRMPRQDSYMFSLGLFSLMEIGGRFTDSPYKKLRDLSGNLKVRLPLDRLADWLPDVAVGVQDVGGGLRVFHTKYAVMTKEAGRFRGSVGYGAGPDRMKGVFGGLEAKAADWLYLLGEYDADETNLGLRIITPELFDYPIQINMTAKTSLDYHPGSFEFGLGLQFPLGFARANRTPLAEKPVAVEPGQHDDRRGVENPADVPQEMRQELPNGETGQIAGLQNTGRSLAAIRDRLEAEGFENLRTGSGVNGQVVVEYENSRFYHNEIDGIGVVAGIVVDHAPPDASSLRLVVKKKGVQSLQMIMPVASARDFFRDPATVSEFSNLLEIGPPVTQASDYFLAATSRSWPKLSLLVYPGLITYVGTEVGSFDYLLSAKFDAYVNLWPGGVLNARLDVPVSWSENFEEGKSFRGNRHESRLDRLMLHQAVKLGNYTMTNFGVGMILHDITGTVNEVLWMPGKGQHRLAFRQAWARDSENDETLQAYVGSYRYYHAPLDLYLTGSGGRFWSQDTGYSLELKRFFGDTAVTILYKNSETKDNQNIQKAAIQFSFPLTPRREMPPYPVQVRGSEEWSYSQEIEVVTRRGKQRVDRQTGVNPILGYNLERVFYNRDRLSESYIRKHLLRMRDAYIEYVFSKRGN